MLSQLPSVCVDSMTQVQLAEFIPRLIQLVTGRPHPFFGKSQFRPAWWPDDIPWASPELVEEENRKSEESNMETLRKVIRSCYKHEGQENLLNSLSLPQGVAKSVSDVPLLQTSKVLSTHDENLSVPNVEIPHSVFSHDSDNPKSPAELLNNMPIWVCFLCAKQFSHQDELMTHQELCEQNAEEEESLPTQAPVVPVVIRRVVKRKRRRRFKPEVYIPPPFNIFIQTLDLMEKPKDESVLLSPQKKDVGSDCEIDVSDYENETTGPVTPRTPKSLISQLSRDGHGEASARKRQLSFSQTLIDSESGDDSESHKQSVPAFNSLLYGIDLCSPLGHRVKKHLKIENTVPVVKNFEKYCCGPEKNEFIEKLRQRDSSYPVVFNSKRKKFTSRFFHRYKFSSADRREFMMRLKTGLSKRGRKLLSEMEPCYVQLKRLDPEVIKEWCRPKPRKMPPAMPSWYRYRSNNMRGPSRPTFNPRYPPMNHNQRTFSSPSRYQGQRRPFPVPSGFRGPNRPNTAYRAPITPNHPAFQEALTKPVFGPKSARIKQINQNIAHFNQGSTKYMVTQVITNPDGTETMKIVCVAGNSKNSPDNRGPSSPSSRRKQTFSQDKLKQMDDEIIIIEMSSSEDEDEETKNKTCKNCDMKTGFKCSQHAGKSLVPSVINEDGNMYLSRSLIAAGSSSDNLTSASRSGSVTSASRSASNIAFASRSDKVMSASLQNSNMNLHPSPPGGRTIRELGLNNMIRSAIGHSSASRNIQFGSSRIGAISGVHSPDKPSSQKQSPGLPVSGRPGPVLQSLLRAPNNLPMQTRIGPNGERLYLSRNVSSPASQPLPKVPNYSVERQKVSDDDKAEVDVICIDDDD